MKKNIKVIIVFSIINTAFCIPVDAQSWNLTGNAGTNPSTNFIGTTDNVGFKIRTKNAVRITVNSMGKVGIGITAPVFKLDVKGGSINTDSVYRIGGNTVLSVKGTGNTFVGSGSGYSNTGNWNSSLGSQALSVNTTGYSNTAFGECALLTNNTGFANVAGGASALRNNTSGVENSAFGTGALYANTIGSSNTANGVYALTSNTSGNFNTATGSQSLYSNTTGIRNTANGTYALYFNTSGNDNIAGGYLSLYLNTTGSKNTAYGINALLSNTEGQNATAIGYNAMAYTNSAAFPFDNKNVAVGYEALRGSLTASANTGNYNTAVGYQTLLSNSTGHSNTANGTFALAANTAGSHNYSAGVYSLNNNSTGNFNTASGNYSLLNNTEGVSNTANGFHALSNNNKGNGNTAHGYYALSSNYAGSNATAIGYNAMLYANNTLTAFNNANVAVGFEALRGSANAAINTGNWNTALGFQTLLNNTSGHSNTANGYTALYSNTGGSYNTANGFNALSDNTIGNFNSAFGYSAHFDIGTLENTTCIGYISGGVVEANNRIEIGNTSVGVIAGQVGWSTYSDARIKDNVKEDVPGLAFISKLRPVTYNLNIHRQNEMVYKDTKKDEATWKSKYDIEKIKMTGFLAQDVEKAANETGYDFSGVQKPADPDELYSLRYSDFVMPLVKAVQELDKTNEELKIKNEKLESEIEMIKSVLSEEQQLKWKGLSEGKSPLRGDLEGLLQQNQPNPFNEETTIRYSVASQFGSAIILVSDNSNRVLKTVSIKQSGNGELIIHAGELAEGAYKYSLIVDGKIVDTKQMLIIK